ncbi:hypothetical protein B296_00026102, partial [Ensete ventricosum]
TVVINDETVRFEIWDTAGQERYHCLAPMYYRGAAAAVVVYDVTNPIPLLFLQATFSRAKKWVQELEIQDGDGFQFSRQILQVILFSVVFCFSKKNSRRTVGTEPSWNSSSRYINRETIYCIFLLLLTVNIVS